MKTDSLDLVMIFYKKIAKYLIAQIYTLSRVLKRQHSIEIKIALENEIFDVLLIFFCENSALFM